MTGVQLASQFVITDFFIADIVPLRTVNRQCSSGLQAVADVAAGIKAGYYDIGKFCSWTHGSSYLMCETNPFLFVVFMKVLLLD